MLYYISVYLEVSGSLFKKSRLRTRNKIDGGIKNVLRVILQSFGNSHDVKRGYLRRVSYPNLTHTHDRLFCIVYLLSFSPLTFNFKISFHESLTTLRCNILRPHVDPRDGFFYPTLTLMMKDSCNLPYVGMNSYLTHTNTVI